MSKPSYTIHVVLRNGPFGVANAVSRQLGGPGHGYTSKAKAHKDFVGAFDRWRGASAYWGPLRNVVGLTNCATGWAVIGTRLQGDEVEARELRFRGKTVGRLSVRKGVEA